MRYLFLILAAALVAVAGQTRTYGVMIGVTNDGYDSPDSVLSCRAGARAMYSFYSANVADGRFCLLVDSDANLRNIEDNINRLFSMSTPEDDILLYVSSHGGLHGLRLFQSSWIKSDMQQLLRGFKARNKYIIIDACHSGTFTRDNFSTTPAPKRLFDRASRRACGTMGNVVVLTSSRDSEFSYGRWTETPSRFTDRIIDALGGAADSNDDSIVSIREVYEHVHGYCSGYGYTQNPQMKGLFNPDAPFISR